MVIYYIGYLKMFFNQLDVLIGAYEKLELELSSKGYQSCQTLCINNKPKLSDFLLDLHRSFVHPAAGELHLNMGTFLRKK